MSRAYPSIYQQGRGDPSELRPVRVDDELELQHSFMYNGWLAMMHSRYGFHRFNIRTRRQLTSARMFFLKQSAIIDLLANAAATIP